MFFLKLQHTYFLPYFSIKHNQMLRVDIPRDKVIVLPMNPVHTSRGIKERLVLDLETEACFCNAVYHWGIWTFFVWLISFNFPEFNSAISSTWQKKLIGRMIFQIPNCLVMTFHHRIAKIWRNHIWNSFQLFCVWDVPSSDYSFCTCSKNQILKQWIYLCLQLIKCLLWIYIDEYGII